MIPFRANIPSRRYPIATICLILANFSVFAYGLGFAPKELDRMIVVSVLVSLFLHGGWLHLLGNTWYLWIFGDNVEDRLGHLRFLIFYLCCGVFATSIHVLMNSESVLPTIGASGSISGVLGAYLVVYPFSRVLAIIPLFVSWPVVEMPSMLVLCSWFLFQLSVGGSVELVSGQTVAEVALWLQIGSFLSGMVLLGIIAPSPRRRYYWV